MRGEDFEQGKNTPYGLGSPPHARGRRMPSFVRRRDSRITPACAGKTSSKGRTLRMDWDHPRMRGEDSRKETAITRRDGSPPHARGRLPRRPRDDGGLGITPACAGKTGYTLGERRRQGDHPRMRGEDVTDLPESYGWLGSPPHARGRPPGRLPMGRRPGITPACAGKTREAVHGDEAGADHPRMRGEDQIPRSDP